MKSYYKYELFGINKYLKRYDGVLGYDWYEKDDDGKWYYYCTRLYDTVLNPNYLPITEEEYFLDMI